jgi:hypothetical protein
MSPSPITTSIDVQSYEANFDYSNAPILNTTTTRQVDNVIVGSQGV